MKKKTYKSQITLPSVIIERIDELNLTNTNKSHCLKFIYLLLRDSLRENETMFSFVDKPKSYLIKVFTSKYNIWLNELINNGIILRTSTYFDGKSYAYSINPDLFKDFNYEDNNSALPIWVEKKHITFINRLIKDVQKNVDKSFFTFKKWFIDDVKSLEIDFNKLSEISEIAIAKTNIDKYLVDDSIPDGVYISSINGIKSDSYTSLKKIKKIAVKNNKHVILKKKVCVIDTLKDFIFNRQISMHINHTMVLSGLKYRSYYANRNEKNKRLDTNLTNMYTPFVDWICAENDLVQIDITNSQFAFLSMVLKNELKADDFNKFKRIAIIGDLYESIQKIIGFDKREMSKEAMFEILFSSRKNHTKNKKRLKEIFPKLIEWIDAFKAKHGDSSFAIFLQRKEAELMIDGVYTSIKQKGLFCLTKHDSVIIKKEDYEEVMEIIKRIFYENGFECQLKITYYNQSTVKTKYKRVEYVLDIINKGFVYDIPYLRNS